MSNSKEDIKYLIKRCKENPTAPVGADLLEHLLAINLSMIFKIEALEKIINPDNPLVPNDRSLALDALHIFWVDWRVMTPSTPGSSHAHNQKINAEFEKFFKVMGYST